MMTEAEAGEGSKLAAYLAKEGGEIAHDMAHHLGDQIFEVMRRNGLAQRSEAGATAMVTIAATMLLEQAIDQCSRAAEEDCRGAVVRLFLNQLSEKTRGAIEDAGIDLADIPETRDFGSAVIGKYTAQGIEAGSGETGTGSTEGESPVAESEAPDSQSPTNPTSPSDADRALP